MHLSIRPLSSFLLSLPTFKSELLCQQLEDAGCAKLHKAPLGSSILCPSLFPLLLPETKTRGECEGLKRIVLHLPSGLSLFLF